VEWTVNRVERSSSWHKRQRRRESRAAAAVATTTATAAASIQVKDESPNTVHHLATWGHSGSVWPICELKLCPWEAQTCGAAMNFSSRNY